jgi:hypothetical protein
MLFIEQMRMAGVSYLYSYKGERQPPEDPQPCTLTRGYVDVPGIIDRGRHILLNFFFVGSSYVGSGRLHIVGGYYQTCRCNKTKFHRIDIFMFSCDSELLENVC